MNDFFEKSSKENSSKAMSKGMTRLIEKFAKESLSELEFRMSLTMKLVQSEFFGFFDYQKQVILDIQNLLDSDSEDKELLKIAIAGANGIGKTLLVSAIITHLIFSGYKGIPISIICLAGKYEQLINVLFRKTRGYLNILDEYKNGKATLNSKLTINSDRITHRDSENKSNCIALSWDISNFDNIKGTHADDSTGLVLVILDECTAIPSKIIEVVKTCTTGSRSIMLAIANPSFKNNSFYTFYNSYLTKKYNVSIFDLPDAVKGNYTALERDIKESHGVDSHQYNTQILGQFSNDSVYSVFPDEMIENAFSRDSTKTAKGPIFIGIDLAGGSEKGDYSVIVVRQENIILEIIKSHQILEIFKETIKEIIGNYARISDSKLTIGIDASGLGLSTYEALERMYNHYIIRVVPSEKSLNVTYVNMRIDLYMRLREWLRFANLSHFKFTSPKSNSYAGGADFVEARQELIQSMRETDMFPESRSDEFTGRYKLGKKEEMYKKSPDILDALSYSFIQHSSEARNIVTKTALHVVGRTITCKGERIVY